MRYMLIKGSKSSGKSVTVREICKRLKPHNLNAIAIDPEGRPVLEPATDGLNGNNYLATIKNKKVLLVAKSPTEQKVRITAILEAVKNMDVQPDFAIISVCGLEKLKDFATLKELENYGQCVYETKIWRIPAHQYNTTEEWNKRIAYLTSIVTHYI